MATGFLQLFQGKIKVGQFWLGRGGYADAMSGIIGVSDFSQKLLLPVTAVANTDFTLSLPPGGCLFSAVVFTTTAYTGTTVTVQLGLSAGDASYVAATTIKAIGMFPLTLVQAAGAGPAIMPNASPNLFIRVVQTGATAVGSSFLVISYTAQ